MVIKDEYLADILTRRMLGLPEKGELNLPSEKDLSLSKPKKALPTLSTGMSVPQAPRLAINPQTEESWKNILLKAVGSGLSSPVTGAVGAISALTESLGIKSKELRDWAQEIQNFYTPKVGKSKAKRLAYGIIQSTLNSLSQAALSEFTGVPLLPMFGVTSGGEKYTQTRQAGFGHKQALRSAIPTGISEAVTEVIPYHAMFEDIKRPLIRRLLKFMGGELIGENINTLVEDIADMLTLKQHKTLQDFIDDAVETTLVTLGQTLLTGGLGFGGQALLRKPSVLEGLKKGKPKIQGAIPDVEQVTKAGINDLVNVLEWTKNSLRREKLKAEDQLRYDRILRLRKVLDKVRNDIPLNDMEARILSYEASASGDGSLIPFELKPFLKNYAEQQLERIKEGRAPQEEESSTEKKPIEERLKELGFKRLQDIEKIKGTPLAVLVLEEGIPREKVTFTKKGDVVAHLSDKEARWDGKKLTITNIKKPLVEGSPIETKEEEPLIPEQSKPDAKVTEEKSLDEQLRELGYRTQDISKLSPKAKVFLAGEGIERGNITIRKKKGKGGESLIEDNKTGQIIYPVVKIKELKGKKTKEKGYGLVGETQQKSEELKPATEVFKNIPAEDETRYYGTEVIVQPPEASQKKGASPVKGKIVRVLNGGELFEIHPNHLKDDPQATFREPAERVMVVKLVDNTKRDLSKLSVYTLAKDIMPKIKSKKIQELLRALSEKRPLTKAQIKTLLTIIDKDSAFDDPIIKKMFKIHLETELKKLGEKKPAEVLSLKEKDKDWALYNTEPDKIPKEDFERLAVQRIEEPGVGRASFDKPHGIYTTPMKYKSPHEYLGGKTYYWLRNPRAKVLEVDTTKFVKSPRNREGVVGQPAGIGALIHFVGEKEYDHLVSMSKKELIEFLSKKYSNINWKQYHDAHELLEAYGAVLAREHGYDAIYGVDKKNPEFTEYVALTKNAMKPVTSPKYLRTEEELSEDTIATLKKKGFSDFQIEKLTPTSAREIIENKYTPEEISVLPSGEIKVFERQQTLPEEIVDTLEDRGFSREEVKNLPIEHAMKIIHNNWYPDDIDSITEAGIKLKSKEKTPLVIINYTDKNRNAGETFNPQFGTLPYKIRKVSKGQWAVYIEEPLELASGKEVEAYQELGRFKTIDEVKNFISDLLKEGTVPLFDFNKPVYTKKGERIPKSELEKQKEENEVDKYANKVSNIDDALKKLKGMQKPRYDKFKRPSLIPGEKEKTSLKDISKAKDTPTKRWAMFKSGVKGVYSDEDKLKLVYSRFEPYWTKATSVGGKYHILNMGNTEFVKKAFKEGYIKDEERSEYDFIISAKEYINGTNFKDYISKGLITKKEAESRIQFFEKFPEKVLKFETELSTGWKDIFTALALKNLYNDDPLDSPHIASLIHDTLFSEKPLFPSEILFSPTTRTESGVITRVSYGLAYAVINRAIENDTKLEFYSLKDVYDRLLKYALGVYISALEGDVNSPLMREIIDAGLSEKQARQLVERSPHYKAYLDALNDIWDNWIMGNMGLYRVDTPLGTMAGLFKWVWDLLKSDVYFEDSKTGKWLKQELKKNILPAIKKFINIGTVIRRVSTDVKHVILFQELSKRLEDAINKYVAGEINIENTQHLLARRWNIIINKYLEGNHKILAKAVAGHEFLSTMKLYRPSDDTTNRYGHSPEAIKDFIATKPSAYETLLFISKWSNSGMTRSIAQELLNLPYVQTALYHVPVEFNPDLSLLKAHGQFDPGGDIFGKITIAPDTLPNELEITALHEAIHASTYYALNFSENSDKFKAQIANISEEVKSLLTKEEVKLGQDLYKKAKQGSMLSRNDIINNAIKKDSVLAEHIRKYGRDTWIEFLQSLYSPEEFLATSMSHPIVRSFLLETKKKSLWQKIVDYIRNLLRLPTSDERLFFKTFNTLLDIVEDADIKHVVSFRKAYNLTIPPELLRPAFDAQSQAKNNIIEEYKPYTLSKMKHYISTFINQVKNAPPQLKDISIIKRLIGMAYWVARENSTFRPLFDHLVGVMENKNFTLQSLLQKGNLYFAQVTDTQRKAIDSAIILSDALNIKLSKKHLSNLPSIVKKLRATFNMMYLIYKTEPKAGRQKAKQRQALLQQLNKETGLNLPIDYSQPQHVIRMKHFFDYCDNFNITFLPIVEETAKDAYYNYNDVTTSTLNHVADVFLDMVSKTIIKQDLKRRGQQVTDRLLVGLSNAVTAVLQNPALLNKYSKEARKALQQLVSDVQDHPLYEKYNKMKTILEKVSFYTPRYRDQDASKMIVVVDKTKFEKAFRTALRQTNNVKAKALQLAYNEVARENGVYLRKHYKRIDPNYAPDLEKIQKIFRDKDYFAIYTLPNYKLAESVYGNITEGDIGAFLSSLAEKTKTRSVDEDSLAKILDEIVGNIREELMARSKAEQRIMRRSPYLVLGYDTDNIKENTFNYVNGATNYMARLQALVEGLPKLNLIDPYQQRRLRDYAHQWFFNQLKPQAKFDRYINKLKSYMFLWFMGGVLRPAIVQSTQMYISTAPMMHIIYDIPMKKALSLLNKAYYQILRHKDIITNPYLTKDEKEFLQITYNNGVTTAQFINQMRDEVAGKGETFIELSKALTTPFAYMEESNRLATALAVYRYLKEENPGISFRSKEAITEATNLINMTHYLMGKINLPIFATGQGVASGLARLALTFTSFTTNLLASYNYMLRHYGRGGKIWGLNKKGLEFVGYSFLAFSLFGGLLSIPFLDDLIQIFERLTGKPLRKMFLRKLGGADSPIAISVERGLPALLLGLDLSGSLKIGIPKSPSELFDFIFGVYGGLTKSVVDSLVAMEGYNTINSIYRILPQVIASPLRAIQAYRGIKNPYGKPVYDENGKPLKTDLQESLLLAMGLRPAKLGKTYLYKSVARNVESYFNKKRQDIYVAYRTAKTSAQRYKVLKMIMEYNKEASKYTSIPRITLRSLKSAMKPLRSKLAEELRLRGY